MWKGFKKVVWKGVMKVDWKVVRRVFRRAMRQAVRDLRGHLSGELLFIVCSFSSDIGVVWRVIRNGLMDAVWKAVKCKSVYV